MSRVASIYTPSLSNMSLATEAMAAPPAPEKLASTFDDDSLENLDKDEHERPESLDRPVIMHSAFFIGMGMTLAIVLVFGFSVGQLISETFIRLALFAAASLIMFSGLFFFQVIFGNIWQLVGPINGLKTNSRHYSCIRPNLRQAYSHRFNPPHVTIQMPVYKEGLDSVIIPTVRSLQAAISYYESRGGEATPRPWLGSGC